MHFGYAAQQKKDNERKDKERYGECRAKRLVLEAFEELESPNLCNPELMVV